MNLHSPAQQQLNWAQEFTAHLLQLKLCGRMGPKLPPPPRRWELRELGKLPAHRHHKMRSKRQRQLKMIEAKQRASYRLACKGWDGINPSRNQILREIRNAPHVYL